MKKLLAICGLAVGALFSAAPASAISITFTPASSHIDVGQTVGIDVSVAGLGDEIVSAYELGFIYNGSILDFSQIVIADFLGPSLGAVPTDTVGTLTLDDASLEDDATLADNQDTSFLMFTLTLTGIADGVTSLGLGPDADLDRNFVGRDAESLNVDIGSACIAVGTGSCDIAVPEPGTFALLGLGLLGLGLGRRRAVAATAPPDAR